MNILFVAQNPAKEINVLNPMVGTKSNRILLEWIEELNIQEYFIINASNHVGKKLRKSDGNISNLFKGLLYIQMPFKIVALGSYAASYLDTYNIKHFMLPHPSGRNFKLNDKTFLNEQLRLCKEYINEDT